MGLDKDQGTPFEEERVMTFRPRLLLIALPLFALAGCATNGPYYGGASTSPNYYNSGQTGAQEVFYGRVTSVRPVMLGRQNSPGVGAVLGAVIGGVVGNQIGHGTGRDLATVGGAVAGGFAGNAIQNNTSQRQGVEIGVRLDDGHDVSVIQDASGDTFYPGDRVRLVGYGQNARVTRY